ncbi:LacI family DNA-binding transcriptional regulator [Streptomyces sp. PU-14G]|uniref:LacI family DNA-binding transcriptional regulator n=1 Tax=Streptomyces sp. PU-14G TaxID=2800808 RepID=UPI0034DE980D
MGEGVVALEVGRGVDPGLACEQDAGHACLLGVAQKLCCLACCCATLGLPLCAVNGWRKKDSRYTLELHAHTGEEEESVTLARVAQHAHVSASTVSRYLRGQLKVNPETAGRIDAAVRDLGYEAPPAAAPEPAPEPRDRRTYRRRGPRPGVRGTARRPRPWRRSPRPVRRRTG